MSEAPRTPSQTVAAQVRKLRGDDLSQRGLGEKMRRYGHRWNDTIVSRVERGERDVSVDELVALALVLRVPLPRLLAPEGGVAIGDFEIDDDLLYKTWLEGHGALWINDDGQPTYDSNLAFEFFERLGLFKEKSD
jgi:hypothetical protein